MNKSNFTIVIQGRTETNCVLKNMENSKGVPVVISTWEGQDLPSLDDSAFVIKNKPPINRGIGNYMMQLVSTLEGLKRVETKYAIKVRGDEFFNYEKLMKYINDEDGFIYSSPVFFRRFSFIPYHISDHIIAGRTDYLKSMFERAKSTYEKTMRHDDCKEWGLTKAHMRNMGFELFGDHDLGKQEMKRLFKIVKIDDLKPYRITVNSHRRIFYDNFIPDQNNSIEDLEYL